MSNKMTFRGVWWIPGSEKRVPGEITYGPTTGATLNLHGELSLEAAGEYTIWGETVNGKEVSLFDCHLEHSNLDVVGVSSMIVTSYSGVIGKHFLSEESMQFNELEVELSHLREWCGISGITHCYSERDKCLVVTQKLPEIISLGRYEDLELSLKFGAKFQEKYTGAELSENCMLSIHSNEPKPYLVLKRAVVAMQELVAFATHSPVYVLKAIAYHNNWKTALGGMEFRGECEIIRNVSIDEGAVKTLRPYEMYFTLSHLAPDPALFISNFLKANILLKPVYELLLIPLYDSRMFIHVRFLLLTHAIEAYHRIMIGGKYLEDDEYEVKVKSVLLEAMPKDLAKDFKESLKNKLKYLHEFSLKKRIRDVCEMQTGSMGHLIGDSETFARSVANKRNNLTHRTHSPHHAESNNEWKSIWLKCEQIALLLDSCLLQTMGLDPKLVESLSQNGPRARRVWINTKHQEKNNDRADGK